jgi:plastocyanin
LTRNFPATTPARYRAGVFVFRLLAPMLAFCVLPACDRVPGVGGDAGPRVLELAHDTIRLAAGVRLVDIEVRRQQGGDFEPAEVQARSGDVVRFTARDRAGHAVVFVNTELAPDVREFLERNGQMRSPPFVTDGTSWVITLEGAPPGEYPFHCTTHDVRGRLTVSAPGS